MYKEMVWLLSEEKIEKNYFFYLFFFKKKTAYEISACLVGSEMYIRARHCAKCFVI